MTEAGTTERIRKVVQKYSLPTQVAAAPEDLLQYISHDKKKRGSQITLIVLKKIGKSQLLPIQADELPKYIRKADIK